MSSSRQPRSDPAWQNVAGDPWLAADRFAMPRGLPRPLYEGLPAPYTVAVSSDCRGGPPAVQPQFKISSEVRMDECQQEALCILCGEQLGEDATVLWDAHDGGIVDDWLHTRCAQLSVSHCPHLVKLKAAGSLRLVAGTVAELKRLPRVGDTIAGVPLRSWPKDVPVSERLTEPAPEALVAL
jgi:hypothetical protein